LPDGPNTVTFFNLVALRIQSVSHRNAVLLKFCTLVRQSTDSIWRIIVVITDTAIMTMSPNFRATWICTSCHPIASGIHTKPKHAIGLPVNASNSTRR